jgi:hypothetical protein
VTGSDARRRDALALFEEVCDLDRSERDARLAAACGDDTALLGDVRALLDADEGAATALDGGPEARAGSELSGLIGRAIAEAGTPARLPERVGSYRVLALLGEGGMGLVYAAEQDSPRRRVALKVMRPSGLSPERVRRMEREVALELAGDELRVQSAGALSLASGAPSAPAPGAEPVVLRLAFPPTERTELRVGRAGPAGPPLGLTIAPSRGGGAP